MPEKQTLDSGTVPSPPCRGPTRARRGLRAAGRVAADPTSEVRMEVWKEV